MWLQAAAWIKPRRNVTTSQSTCARRRKWRSISTPASRNRQRCRVIAKALGDIARAQGMSHVARGGAVARESLQGAFGRAQSRFATVLKPRARARRSGVTGFCVHGTRSLVVPAFFPVRRPDAQRTSGAAANVVRLPNKACHIVVQLLQRRQMRVHHVP